MVFLDLEGVEAMVGQAVLQKAIDMEAERDQRWWRNMEAAVQNGTARAFGGR